MKNIDFLPSRFHERARARRSRLRTLWGVAALLAVVAVARAGQWTQRRAVESQLAALRPQHAQAIEARQQLLRLQAELASREQFAQLYTYLRHPWPRTQLLWAVTSSLPPGVRLSDINIAQQTLEPLRPAAESQGSATTKPPAATSDLLTLQRENDHAATEIVLSGIVTESAALQQYVAQCSQAPLFVRTKLDSLESVELGERVRGSRFILRLVVRPGYGQPAGPTAPPAGPAATTHTAFRPEKAVP